MNIAITGHKGLIGSFLTKRLEKEGHKIVLAIDKKDGIEIADLSSFETEDNIDMMIHAAALCKINKSIEDPELGHENAVNTFKVFEFVRKNKIKKIINFSSSRVLYEEKNPYTSGKIYGEELSQAYKQCYDIDYLIIRPSTVYAPIWDETRRLIHIFITNALNNVDLEIYGDPDTKTLDFTYIDDFVDGVMIAINNKWNEEYTITGNSEYNIYRLAEFIIERTNSKSKIIVKKPEIAQPQEVRSDSSKIRSLGYEPKYTVEEGVLKTIEWYKSYLNK